MSFWGWWADRFGRRWAMIIPAALAVPIAPIYLLNSDPFWITIGYILQGAFGLDDFRSLVLDLAPAATTPAELLTALNDATATPEIPPDVTQVRIMSLHKSKGLSSPVVVIAGCIEGLLPAAPDRDKSPEEQQADLEEQRRLLYVGLTRVKAVPETNQPGVLLLTHPVTVTKPA